MWPACTSRVLCAVLYSDLVNGGKPTAVNSVCVVQSISKQNSELRLTLGLRWGDPLGSAMHCLVHGADSQNTEIWTNTPNCGVITTASSWLWNISGLKSQQTNKNAKNKTYCGLLMRKLLRPMISAEFVFDTGVCCETSDRIFTVGLLMLCMWGCQWGRNGRNAENSWKNKSWKKYVKKSMKKIRDVVTNLRNFFFNWQTFNK